MYITVMALGDWDCVNVCLLTTVIALDYRQNFVSAQYLEKYLIELDQILHMH